MEKSEHRFEPSRSVYTAVVDHCIVILDLHHDIFLGLNQTASAMWSLLTMGKTPLEVAQMWSKADNVDATILNDVTSFAENMCFKQLLEVRNDEGVSNSSDRKQAWPFLAMRFSFQIARHFFRKVPNDFLEAYITLFYLHYALIHEGFLGLVKEMNSQPTQVSITTEDALIKRLAHTIKVAADWHRFPAVCLHQSLALCWMLRRRTIHADVVIGVYTHPFSAHVWVGYRDDILSWEAGMGSYPDMNRLAAMEVVFHSGRYHLKGGINA